jgi:hypothetical protein
MKPQGSIRVVRKWRGMRADLSLGVLDDPEGLNNGYMHSGNGPRVRKLANGMRLGM